MIRVLIADDHPIVREGLKRIFDRDGGIEVVGEAAGRVSDGGRARYDSLPWKGMIGMRNRLIHGYDAINTEILWDTIQDEFPALIRELDRYLSLDTNS